MGLLWLSLLALLQITLGSRLGFRHKRKKLNHTHELKKSNTLIADFRSSITGVVFNAAFTNYTVLQREPQISAIYGTCDSSTVSVSLSITDDNSDWSANIDAISGTNGDWKVLLPKPMENGGSFTINAKCAKCTNASVTATIYHVTFGDVYYCAGQSNMELDMHYTFSREDTYKALENGKYGNIRYMTQYFLYVSDPEWVIPTSSNSLYHWHIPTNTTLDTFSAVCWYFAQTLHDKYMLSNITIGLIDTSSGGSMIESWIKNKTVQLSCKDTLCPASGCGGLYNGLVAPYVNYTIKGVLWYQGENNVFEDPGSWMGNTGYGCMEPFMYNQWRDIWSVVANTTPYDLPFGLVTLAAGTSEGHQSSMGAFRVAQQANYNFMPNNQMQNSFVALAHDLGDPFAKDCAPACYGNVPYSTSNTSFYMGPVHPRPKIQVGERLARTGYPFLYGNGNSFNGEITTGPLISGCTLNNVSKTIVIRFNTSFLNGLKVRVEPFVAWYNTSLTVEDWSAMQVSVDNVWQFVDIKAGAVDNEVIVNISAYVSAGKVIKGLQYAYFDFPCCGNLNKAKHPCPPDSCPIKAGVGNDTLPAVPFYAVITVNGTCQCVSPETCSE